MDSHLSFPTGLFQPTDGFRFSVDSLLLASFVQCKKNMLVADLGTGCGVVGIALLLRCASQGISVHGIDNHPAMIACAKKNVSLFHVQESFHIHEQDLLTVKDKSVFVHESFDAVLANPPYFSQGSGRISPTKDNKSAKFSSDSGLDPFLKATAYLLKNKGSAFFIFPAERMHELLNLLLQSRLQPKRMMCIHPKTEKQAIRVLVEAKKNVQKGMCIEPPLILYNEDDSIQKGAKKFCPFLDTESEN